MEKIKVPKIKTVTKEMLKKIIELYPFKTNSEIAEEIGVDDAEILYMVMGLRQAGVKLGSKQRKGIATQIKDLVNEMRESKEI